MSARSRVLHAALTVLIAAAVPSSLAAQTIAASSFDSNNDGWRYGSFTTASCAPGAASHVASGGVSGGFVRLVDACTYNAYLAPSTYGGNQSAAYGGSFSFYLRATGASTNYPVMTLYDGTTLLQYFGPAAPNAASFTPYTVGFTELGWQIASDGVASGAAATQSQFQTVIANLTKVAINADWSLGGDQVDLDEVKFCGPQGCAPSTTVPEPSTVALLSAGLLAVGLVARRRRAA